MRLVLNPRDKAELAEAASKEMRVRNWRRMRAMELLAERAVDYLDGLSEDDVLRLSGLLSSKVNWLLT